MSRQQAKDPRITVDVIYDDMNASMPVGAIFLYSTGSYLSFIGNIIVGNGHATLNARYGIHLSDVSGQATTIVRDNIVTAVREAGCRFASGANPILDKRGNYFSSLSGAEEATPTGITAGEGFYGKAAIAKTTVRAAATDAATTQTLTNELRAALIALGLIA